ncbi:hypothetical protein IHE44_0014274 [Lamprotornis superbus]|uniref:Uncharacterized protein n=1 Tax=Lamprotornis superbus TaxID=245042 RepID=A0A835NQT3_9PASS|nr:hypothetical protein IHE44_0014274 [Lamprotornis superbus]
MVAGETKLCSARKAEKAFPYFVRQPSKSLTSTHPEEKLQEEQPSTLHNLMMLLYFMFHCLLHLPQTSSAVRREELVAAVSWPDSSRELQSSICQLPPTVTDGSLFEEWGSLENKRLSHMDVSSLELACVGCQAESLAVPWQCGDNKRSYTLGLSVNEKEQSKLSQGPKGLESRLVTAGQGAVIRGEEEILLWRSARDQVPKKGIGSKWGYTLRFQEACAGCGRFVTIKAQEVEEYEGVCLLWDLPNKWSGKPLGYGSKTFAFTY